jgi:predicted ribosomally synthesized peptide with nif11-like leader
VNQITSGRFKEVLNSEEAAQLLGVKPFTIRTYARRGLIPGKKLGNEWRFVRDDLLDWLKDMGVEVANLERALSGAKGFVQRLSRDSKFKQQVESVSTHEDFIALERQEGFIFTIEELKEALKPEPDQDMTNVRKAKILRRGERFQVYLSVSELNGQPVSDTMILDINAWGARIGTFKPFDTSGPIKVTFTPPGESKRVNIAGQVVWSRLVPEDSQYHIGIEFLERLD